jgi:hypothetical protein
MQSQRGTTFLFSVVLLAGIFFLLPSSSLLSQEVKHGGPTCDLTGAWYGGSVVAYQMTIIPAPGESHVIVFAEGMYKNSVMNTVFTGEFAKKGNRYEGSLIQMTTPDPDFLNPPPIGKMPDTAAVWGSMEMLDCNTIKNTIPFFGIYLAANIWQPGIVWVAQGKVPLIDPPDVDLLDILAGGKPIVETYHRLSPAVNPALLHHN